MPASALSPAESLALWRIAETEGIGPMGFRRLLARHGSGRAALEALPRLLAKRETPARIPNLDDARREADAMGWRRYPASPLSARAMLPPPAGASPKTLRRR